MKSFSSILIGEQSLLVQCGEQLLQRGHQIVAVVAANTAIKEWCSSCNILQFDDLVALNEQGFSDQEQPDYLFSITNLKILPAELLAMPKQMAINFHDGPLPAYAGLNVPVWALLNGESEHGVTFHRMQSKVDLGEILVQRKFGIEPDETAFTLNARCYQEGLEAFVELVALLESNTLTPITQNQQERSYFAARKRPAVAGCIDWQRPAEQIQRLLRALNFGGYLNPLLMPKIWLGEHSLIVSEVSSEGVDNNNSGKPQQTSVPGTVLAFDQYSISIQAQDRALKFSGLCDLAGSAVSPIGICREAGIEEGAILPVMPSDVATQLDKIVSQVCLTEPQWSKRLQNAEPVSAPFASLTNVTDSSTDSQWEITDCQLLNVLDSDFVIASLSLLFARLGGKDQFTLAVQWNEQNNNLNVDAVVASFFERWLPLPVDYKPGQKFSDFVQCLQHRISKRELIAGFLKDLYLRDPQLDASQSVSGYPIKIRIIDDESAVADSAGITSAIEGQNALLIDILSNGNRIRFHYNPLVLSEDKVARLNRIFLHLFSQLEQNPEQIVSDYSLLDARDQQSLEGWNSSVFEFDRSQCVHQLIEQQVERSPEAIACYYENQQISYQELNARANQLARLLIDEGVSAGDLVGILLNRSIDMLIALIAVYKTGAAYVPLDPVYPRARLQYMVEDSALKVLLLETKTRGMISGNDAQQLCIEQHAERLAEYSTHNVNLAVDAKQLAYVIYTSGSTGKPKGVMVEHRNVVNFFAGMDQRLQSAPGTWLAVTSISFDISVLELFWTLSRGLSILLYSDVLRQKVSRSTKASKAVASTSASKQNNGASVNPGLRQLEFGLFYWNVATDESQYDADKYRLLLESARYADQHGFNAVWTPERHFASFGGLFPNPSVTSAALATITENVALRAGSCVVPLHSPIRIAEEWAVVDNLSGGRVGLSIAAGWASPDFAIKPENFSDAKSIMFESAEKLKQLWRGETLTFPGPDGDVEVRTLPRPLQAELPIWVTTAGNIDSFIQAGKTGANVLTHLLGQTIEGVAEKVQAYRKAWQQAGHPGRGLITVMLHTFAGPDQHQVEELVREPMKNYLKSAMFLVKSAAWQFPTFKQLSDEQGKSLDEFFETISEQDMDDLLEFAFHRYFSASGLFGTPEDCQQMIDKVYQADCDEIACLIDFGIDTEIVLDHLPYLNQVRQMAQARLCPSDKELPRSPLEQLEDSAGLTTEHSDFSLPALLARHDVTHFQCTPSMATMLVADDAARPGLAKLRQMMVGGEAFPPALAVELSALVGGRVSNMYGPTETTIWSSTGDVDNGANNVESDANEAENDADNNKSNSVSIGRVLANQRIYILDEHQQPLPSGIPGELVIGGEGVVRGYLNREELTAERFLPDPFSDQPGARMYRTGDLARYCEDGQLECLGRVDNQVKIRGYRIELGEIESLLREDGSVAEVAVLLREDVPGDQRLVAYIRASRQGQVPVEALKALLAKQLPVFMVPSHFMELPSLPLTPNGKIDRNALPRPSSRVNTESQSSDNKQQRSISGPSVATGQMENLVLSIWKQALDLDEIAMDDNFFDIGGHSLLVIQVLKELREKTGQSIQMTDLFRYTTVSALAKFLSVDSDEPDTKRSGRAEARKARRGRRA